MNGTLSGPNPGTIRYTDGRITIAAEAGNSATAIFRFYPNLAILGLEDLELPSLTFPGTIDFNKRFSYNTQTSSPFTIHNVSFYKNPPSGSFTGYTQKTTWTPTFWNGQDYQQFWTTNYEGALWATNGTEVPFSTTNIGMQYKAVGVNGAVVVSATDVDFTTTTNHPFVVGDFVFANEFTGVNGLNFQTGFVISPPAPGATTFRARFPSATISGGPGSNGIVQALTTMCQPDVASTTPTTTRDCLRFYDGQPVDSSTTPAFMTSAGWVNFCPPLVSGPNTIFPIANLPAAQYYLIGAKMIVPFKDRLLFIGPIVQTSVQGSQKYLQDTVIYSQNGTPYYTGNFPYTTVNPSASVLATATTTPILVPSDQTSQPSTFWEDLPGFGGFIQAGFSEPIVTVSSNEDVLIMGFARKKARFVYTGNDIIPFNFFVINSEYGSQSTFSAINMDRGVLDIGSRGLTLTTQVSSERMDLEIPDEIFQFGLSNRGRERVCAQRDFLNEWVFFSYLPNETVHFFPTQTLFFNYRNHSWAIFHEAYTSYGLFRQANGLLWQDITYLTWDEWNDPWDSGSQTVLNPKVIAGTSQGFIMIRDQGTGEDPSNYISDILGTTITSPNHCLDTGDYIVISGVIGTAAATFLNGKIFQIKFLTTDTFQISLATPIPADSYIGDGVFTRIYVPMIQTKQFPVAWEMGRKTRIGPQQYLFTTTDTGQITLLIFLSQNGASSYNLPQENGAIIYSTVLPTSPELGSTVAVEQQFRKNLLTPDASSQAQIWHRMNTSLIGDTVQIGFTLSDAQLLNSSFLYQFKEIELHSFILDVSPSQVLA
jgi:hypothetical protein